MAVKGVFTSDAGIVGDRKGDFASALLVTHPTGSAPMLALTSGMESAPARDVIITWFEENHNSGRINVTNNAASGTALVVDDDSNVIVGQVYLVESTGEYLFVTAVAGSNVTVERGFTGTGVVALDGSVTPKPIQKLITAFEEGSDAPVAQANIGFPVINYTQIVRNKWEVTGTASVVEFYTGDRIAKNKADASVFHSEDIERGLLFGRKTVGHKNNKPFRTMDGLLAMITTNVTAQGANTKWIDLQDHLQNIFAYNIRGKPNERIAFCGNTVLKVINQISQLDSTINIEPGQTEFGLKVNRLMTPFGDVSLMTHPLMNESPLWTKDLFIFHPGAIRVRYARRTFWDNYDQEGRRAGVDADYGVITTELSCEYKGERTGGKYTGIDTPAAAV